MQVIPIFQSSRKRFTANATYKPTSVESSDTAEYVRPLEFRVICNQNTLNINQIESVLYSYTQFSLGTSGRKYDLTNHGNPRQSKMSNVFDPIELLMPIAPCPWLVTITLDTASGTLVPAARKVKPITESGMFNVSPGVY